MRIAAATVLMCCSASTIVHAGGDEIRRALAKYDTIDHFHQYASYYRELYSACEVSDINKLCTNANDSIAVQSAWEIVTLSVPPENDRRIYRPDAQKLSWFIGFLEGRTKTVTPAWWREGVTDARANRRLNIYPGEARALAYQRSDVDGVRCPIGAFVADAEGQLTYRNNESSGIISETLLDRNEDGKLDCGISCDFIENRCYTAVHDDVGYPHVVACIDQKTHKVVWKSKACGCCWRSADGLHRSSVAVVVAEDGRRVFVYGAASIGFYVHGFDASSGKTLFHFSNRY